MLAFNQSSEKEKPDEVVDPEKQEDLKIIDKVRNGATSLGQNIKDFYEKQRDEFTDYANDSSKETEQDKAIKAAKEFLPQFVDMDSQYLCESSNALVGLPIYDGGEVKNVRQPLTITCDDKILAQQIVVDSTSEFKLKSESWYLQKSAYQTARDITNCKDINILDLTTTPTGYGSQTMVLGLSTTSDKISHTEVRDGVNFIVYTIYNKDCPKKLVEQGNQNCSEGSGELEKAIVKITVVTETEALESIENCNYQLEEEIN